MSFNVYLCILILKLQIINGPNLNLLGKREPSVYGGTSFEEFFNNLRKKYPTIEFSYIQSNVEGELINSIQQADEKVDFILLNAAAYSHTSIAIADAVAAISTPTIGIHISNIYQREKERHIDLLAKNCIACLFGFGLIGYDLAIQFILNKKKYGQ